MKCVNTNTREYQTLKHRSGLSDSALTHQVGNFLDTVGRYPHLDELSGADSELAIKDDLKLNKDSVTSLTSILEATNSSDIDEAIPKLNDVYRDKEIEVSIVNDNARVYITPKPSTNPSEIGQGVTDSINSFHYFNEIISKMEELYGIRLISITNNDLANGDFKDVPGVSGAKAFVFEGNIYVNTDIATVDSPVHELLHLLLGSLKYSDPETYQQIVEQAEDFSSYGEVAEMYPNRTKSDVNEEVFVTELAKYLVGRESSISELPQQHEIFYSINRALDIMLMGDASVKCIPIEDLYQMSLKTIGKLVNASTMQDSFQTSLNASMLGRIMSNKKSELMSKGELKEECS